MCAVQLRPIRILLTYSVCASPWVGFDQSQVGMNCLHSAAIHGAMRRSISDRRIRTRSRFPPGLIEKRSRFTFRPRRPGLAGRLFAGNCCGVGMTDAIAIVLESGLVPPI
jgi:hypothetical protein